MNAPRLSWWQQARRQWQAQRQASESISVDLYWPGVSQRAPYLMKPGDTFEVAGVFRLEFVAAGQFRILHVQ